MNSDNYPKIWSLTPNGKDYLKLAADSIEKYPEHFNMDYWCNRLSRGFDRVGILCHFNNKEIQSGLDCGTTLCIAGWIAWHASPKMNEISDSIPIYAYKQLFGVVQRETCPLFYHSEWYKIQEWKSCDKDDAKAVAENLRHIANQGFFTQIL